MEMALLVVVRLIHLIALALAVGAATAKNVLLYKCKKDISMVPTFLRVEKSITRQIIAGQVLLTLSGIAYAYMLGYGFTPRVNAKVGLLALLWVLGPVIDNAIGPRFRAAVPAPGQSASPAFDKALNHYLLWDVAASGIFYAIVILWVATA